tara:strand:+ start:51 stop:512 length:462 start_codon:yes stop_codon:yes gene_type:complete
MGRVFFNTVENVDTLIAAYTVIPSDSGKTFMLDLAAGFVVTLPADADTDIGWNCRFYVKTAADDAYLIKCQNVSGDQYVGGFSVASTTAGFGHAVLAAANDSQISFDANLANGAGEPGSYMDIVKIAANNYAISGFMISDDADSDGSAVLSNI